MLNKSFIMKPLRKLKLSDVAPAEIDASAMGELYAGIDEGIMLLSYGCDSYVCNNNSTEGRKDCTEGACKSIACTSGAQG